MIRSLLFVLGAGMDTRDAMEEKRRCRGTEGRRGWCFMGRQRTEVRGVEKKPLVLVCAV